MAERILRHLAGCRRTLDSELQRSVCDLIDQQQTVARTWRMITKARSRSFDLAASRLTTDLFDRVSGLHYHIPQVLARQRTPPMAVSLGTIHAELKQLQREFDLDILLDRDDL